LRQWQPLVYDACTGCGRCDMMCPMGISLSPMIHVMRQGLASAGLEPDEFKELGDEQRDRGTVFGVGADELRQCIEKIEARGLSVPLDKKRADVVLLTTAVEVIVFSDTLAATARIMQKLDLDWTLLTTAFEATNIGLLSGDEAVQEQATRTIVEKAAACGARTLIVPETGHAYQALRWEAANELGEALPFEVLALSEFIAREAESGRLKLKPAANGGSVAYHDPCRLGRQSGVYEEPRNVLKALGLELRDTDSNRRENYCCGGGCGEYVIKRAAPLRQKAFEIKKREFERTGADTIVTACANCRVNLSIGADNTRWSKPIKGLAEMVADNLAD
jgi:Fe-S oxidoreductase